MASLGPNELNQRHHIKPLSCKTWTKSSFMCHLPRLPYIHHQSLLWRHYGRDSVSNHQPHDCQLNHSFCEDQRKYQSSASLAFVRGIFSAQRASNTENVPIWWRHRDFLFHHIHFYIKVLFVSHPMGLAAPTYMRIYIHILYHSTQNNIRKERTWRSTHIISTVYRS